MNETEKILLEAAMRVFSRYGVRRSSMNDLCQEAGVSRQTFYNTFRNKDDILRNLIRAYTERAIAGIEAGLPATRDLGERLDLVFDRMVVAGYDEIQAMPNAQDFIEGINAVSEEELECAGERFRALIERILAPHEAALARAGLTPSRLADFVQRAAKAAPSRVRDRAHLVQHLGTLRQLCLAAALDGVPIDPAGPDSFHTKDDADGQQAS